MIGTQAVLLVKHRAHQIGSAQDALHQEVGFSLGTQGHGLGRAVLVGIAGDDLVVIVPLLNNQRLKDSKLFD